jgi:hypothetical protein
MDDTFFSQGNPPRKIKTIMGSDENYFVCHKVSAVTRIRKICKQKIILVSLAI